jgi:hypothetical protein
MEYMTPVTLSANTLSELNRQLRLFIIGHMHAVNIQTVVLHEQSTNFYSNFYV